MYNRKQKVSPINQCPLMGVNIGVYVIYLAWYVWYAIIHFSYNGQVFCPINTEQILTHL